MAKGTTVFERWREKRRQAGLDTEEKYLNPLGVKLGDLVELDRLDWRGLDFTITQFRVVTRKIGRDEFPFTDYYLRHRGLKPEDEIFCLLRYIPLDDPDPDSGKTHEVYLLELVEESEHSEQIMEVLAANSGYTYYTDVKGQDDWEEQVFPTRVNDVETPYDCDVDIVQDKDHDGEVEDDEVESHKATLWDFWRLISAEGSKDVTEYLFVEVDQDDGWTELFRGEEVDPATVTKM
jgi:hypothetical protein